MNVTGKRASIVMNAFSLESVIQFPTYKLMLKWREIGLIELNTHPRAVVIKFQSADTTRRAMVGPWRFPLARAGSFIADSKIPAFVSALIWLC